ncbi:hypothetical protein BGW42_002285 [Actinomortierella wolfii]|nr:hypothetical protein BGW42_002285 [Actinomortierella wolfii]
MTSITLDFNQCSLPIEFVYRVVVGCVDEIMERGLNHRFILQNQYSASVVASMLTLMADPERRNLFSLKCMRIDTVVGVMLSVLKNIREPIVPLEIQDELTSASGMFLSVASTPTTPAMASSARLQRSPSSGYFQQAQFGPRINTVASLLNHPNFPAVNRALLMELLNLSLAILNRSTFNCSRPDVLAGVLGPLIFATQHATILQHTPQQAYSFGWGVSLVSDIQRCTKMFYVVLGGYRREVLGPEDFDYDQALYAAAAAVMNANNSNNNNNIQSGAYSSSATSRGGYQRSTSGDISSWIGSTSKASIATNNGSTGALNGLGSGHHGPHAMSKLRPEFSRFGGVGNISTTFTESVRAAAAQEAQQLGIRRSSSGSKGRAALAHLREGNPQDDSRDGSGDRRWKGGAAEDAQPELFRARLRPTNRSALLYESNGSIQGHPQHQEEGVQISGMSAYERQKEERRQEIENMIRGCRGTRLNLAVRESEQPLGVLNAAHGNREGQNVH